MSHPPTAIKSLNAKESHEIKRKKGRTLQVLVINAFLKFSQFSSPLAFWGIALNKNKLKTYSLHALQADQSTGKHDLLHNKRLGMIW